MGSQRVRHDGATCTCTAYQWSWDFKLPQAQINLIIYLRTKHVCFKKKKKNRCLLCPSCSFRCEARCKFSIYEDLQIASRYIYSLYKNFYARFLLNQYFPSMHFNWFARVWIISYNFDILKNCLTCILYLAPSKRSPEVLCKWPSSLQTSKLHFILKNVGVSIKKASQVTPVVNNSLPTQDM